MGILPILLVAALALSAIGLALFRWAVADGQFDELDGKSTLPLRELPPRPEREP